MLDKIKFFAKKKGTTLAQIERDLGFSQGYIRRWDTQKPAYDRILKVANHLEIPIEYLTETTEISTQEAELISFYRKSDKPGKDAIMSIAEFHANKNKESLKPFA